MSAAAESELFARKGHATPAGMKGLALNQSDRAEVATKGLPLFGGAPVEAGDAEAEQADTVGSLLTFRLRGRTTISEELRAVIDGTDKTADEVSPTRDESAPEPADEAVAAAAQSQPAPVDPMQEPAPPLATDAPDAEKTVSIRPPSTRIDRPLFAPAPATALDTAPAQTTPLVTRPAPLAEPTRPSLARTVLPAAAAVVAVAVVGWLIAHSDPAVVPAEPEESVVAAASSEPARAPAEAASQEEAEQVADTAPALPQDAAPAVTETAVPPPTEEAVAAAPAVVGEIEPAIEPAAASDGGASMAPSMPTMPTLDVVRVEPGAAPVIAGRATPGSELLVLDNGVPLGSATADANGEWALVGEAPLPAGRHELTLALKTSDGPLVIEQADTVAPAAVEAEAEALLVPPAKPVATSTPGKTPYVIQLASVPSSADAEREWARLQAAHPALLGDRAMMIDAVQLGDRGTFYRLRTGPFPDREAARVLCRQLSGAGQECLVVRQAAE